MRKFYLIQFISHTGTRLLVKNSPAGCFTNPSWDLGLNIGLGCFRVLNKTWWRTTAYSRRRTWKVEIFERSAYLSNAMHAWMLSVSVCLPACLSVCLSVSSCLSQVSLNWNGWTHRACFWCGYAAFDLSYTVLWKFGYYLQKYRFTSLWNFAPLDFKNVGLSSN